jgi:hypothetical protein
MLSAAVIACVDCRQGNCVHLSLDPAESPAGRQSLAGGAGRGRRPGTFAVAKAVGRRVACLSDGRMGRPSGECRLKAIESGTVCPPSSLAMLAPDTRHYCRFQADFPLIGCPH